MAAAARSMELPPPGEDLSDYLPATPEKEYSAGGLIYGPGEQLDSVYLVISGRVEIARVSSKGKGLLLDIVMDGELFGDSAFLGGVRPAEQAGALQNTRLMTWSVAAVENLVIKQPRLGVALLQAAARRNAESARRIESFSRDSIEQRLARSLIRFSERLGVPDKDGSMRMMPLTHELLSRYVGTSREIVTRYMNQFRQQGYLNYSRQSILVHGAALRTALTKSKPPGSEN